MLAFRLLPQVYVRIYTVYILRHPSRPCLFTGPNLRRSGNETRFIVLLNTYIYIILYTYTQVPMTDLNDCRGARSLRPYGLSVVHKTSEPPGRRDDQISIWYDIIRGCCVRIYPLRFNPVRVWVLNVQRVYEKLAKIHFYWKKIGFINYFLDCFSIYLYVKCELIKRF